MHKLAVCIFMVFALTGCGGSGAEDNQQPDTPPSSSAAPSSISSSAVSSSSALTSDSSSLSSVSSSSSLSSSIHSSSSSLVSSTSSSNSSSSMSLSSSSASSVSSESSISSESSTSSEVSSATSSSSESSSEPELTPPHIQKITLVAYSAAGDATLLRELHHGDTVDLAEIHQDKINLAVETDVPTASMQFLLKGPIDIDRWDNGPVFTLAAAPNHLSIA